MGLANAKNGILAALFISAASAAPGEATPAPLPLSPAASSLSLSQTFAAACYPTLALADQGLGRKIELSFSDVVPVAAAKADVLILGEVHIENDRIEDFYARPENMAAFEKSGFTNMFHESPPIMQSAIDNLITGNLDRQGFAEEISRLGYQSNWYKNEAGESDPEGYMRDHSAPLIQAAYGAGIKTHAIDFPLELEKEEEKIRREMNSLRKGGKHPPGYDPTAEEDPQYHKLAERYHLLQEKNRNDYDPDVAAKINGIAQGGKSIVMYGVDHWSEDNDVRNNFAGGTVKINVFASAAIYQDFLAEGQGQKPIDGVKQPGVNKPDLVFFVKENQIFETCNTSPELSQALRQAEQQQVVPQQRQSLLQQFSP